MVSCGTRRDAAQSDDYRHGESRLSGNTYQRENNHPVAEASNAKWERPDAGAQRPDSRVIGLADMSFTAPILRKRKRPELPSFTTD
jgi:hypothetical protein